MEQQDIRELKVREIMHKDWPTLGPNATVEEAIKLFDEARISGAPVVYSEYRLLGILTEGDLIFQDADVKAPGFLDILGGMIPLINMAIGLEVAGGFMLLISEFLEQTLVIRRPGEVT